MTGWALASLVLVAVFGQQISHLWFPDVDDAMRLLEVRDWIAGQSWWDVSQHRLNGGHFAMHWSRLVDVPLAALLLLLEPLLGIDAATRVTITAVPLLTMFCVMALAAFLTRRVAGDEPARLAPLLVPLSVPLLFQLRPMRIDHHGWQIALAMAAMLALLAPPSRRSGAGIGLALGTLVVVSLEGLPVAAAILGVAVLGWCFAPERRAQMLGALWTMTATVLVLHVATRGPGMFAPACDAIAPGWIGTLIAATLGITVAAILFQRRSWHWRLAGAAAAGALALAVLATSSPACLAGPFASLDPLVRSLWYENVLEGRPAWEQPPLWAALTLGLPLSGLIGGILALRTSQGEARGRWAMLVAVAALALLLSLLVIRSGATAIALAIPGCVWLVHRLLLRARRIRAMPLRVLGTAGALAVAAPGLVLSMVLGTPTQTGVAQEGASGGRPACQHIADVAALNQLPPATLFAPIDVSPDLLVATRHRAIGGGYHRNPDAIRRVFTGFLAQPDTAHRIIAATGARYVVGCPGLSETALYRRVAPNGLWARLERGESIPWLQPVPIHGSAVLAWRVR